MNSEIVKNHSAISATSLRFLDYAVTQAQCLSKLDLLDDDLPPMLRDYKYGLHSWPWFISRKTRAMLEDCVRRIPDLVARAVLIEFGSDAKRFCEFYSMSEIMAALVLSSGVDTRYTAQRTDAIMTSSGLKIVELNLGSSIGGWQIQWMDHQYRKQRELAPFFDGVDCHSRNILSEYMSFLIRSIKAQGLTNNGEVNVLFTVAPGFIDIDGPSSIREIFNEQLKKHGCSGTIRFRTSFADLNFRTEGVYLDGQRVGCVVSVTLSSQAMIPIEMFRASLSNHVLWMDNPLEAILADKRSLSLLYRHRNDPNFSVEDRLAINTFLPWAAPMVPGVIEFEGEQCDLRALVLARKDRFVVKVASGAQGNDVFVGKHTTDAEWALVVERGLAASNWVVQEFCVSLPFYGQLGPNGFGVYDVVWGVFGFGNEYGGCWLRLMERDTGKGVINSDKGAQESIVYEVDD